MIPVVGLDLSLTASGIASPGGVVTRTPPKPHGRGMPRLRWFRDRVMEVVHAHRPELVVIEGYSFGQARGNALSHLGELGGVIRLALFEEDWPYIDVPPAVLKKYATGRGNAGKEEVLAAAIRRLGYEGHDNNQADALWLYAIGRELLGSPVVEMPKAHRESLTKLTLPHDLRP